jgi:hypothetical protein
MRVEDASLDGVEELVQFRFILGVDPGGEAVVGAVCVGDGERQIVEWKDAEERQE